MKYDDAKERELEAQEQEEIKRREQSWPFPPCLQAAYVACAVEDVFTEEEMLLSEKEKVKLLVKKVLEKKL